MTLVTPCPFCGHPVLWVLGATVVKDKEGTIVLRCPRCGR